MNLILLLISALFLLLGFLELATNIIVIFITMTAASSALMALKGKRGE